MPTRGEGPNIVLVDKLFTPFSSPIGLRIISNPNGKPNSESGDILLYCNHNSVAFQFDTPTASGRVSIVTERGISIVLRIWKVTFCSYNRHCHCLERMDTDDEKRELILLQDEDEDEDGVEVEGGDEQEQVQHQGSDTRKRRGRKPKSFSSSPPTAKKAEEEEDVCFACYDGGNLVLCDRKRCPKAYHAECVGGDETFVQSKGPWICGWHTCTECEKPAKFLCYTCTYSVCRTCIREVEFVCLKKNRGFCENCLPLVLMIEEDKDVHSDGVKVDFSDRETWEYLFKDYWLELKDKLSLTLMEIKKAKNPYKDVEDIGSDVSFDENDASSSSSDNGSDQLVEEYEISMKRRRRRSRTFTGIHDDTRLEQESGKKAKLARREFTGWASKELLEFIRFVKQDTEKVFSIFEVQRLLLQYIKENKLQDPRKKSVISCDERLHCLFGKPFVGRFEMLKLLESHFSSKQSCFVEESSVCEIQEDAQHDNDNRNDLSASKEKISRITDRKRKTRKKVDEKALRPNPNDYAAINVHNIGLVYLRRTLIEDLLEDLTSFYAKVVGSFVRIRTSGVGNRQEVFYRIVQVVGTKKIGEPYYTGRRTTDIILEILNLNKKEDVSIDAVSNQDFTEEECKRLRQSVRCGLVTRPTVIEIEEKAQALHEVKLNDWFETELLRLSHLRDRASEKGHRKELRECVEKLQLLSSPDERARKLQEIPEVIADPNVDPDYDSDDKEDMPKGSNQGMDSYQWDNSKGGWDGVQQISGNTWENRKSSTSSRGQGWKRSQYSTQNHGWSHDHLENNVQNTNSTNWSWGKEKSGDEQSSGWDSQKSFARDDGIKMEKSLSEKNVTGSNWCGSYARVGSLHSSSEWQQEKDQTHKSTVMVGLLTKPPTMEGISETGKIWHYKDPTGTIQGPFSMLQLRKWNMKGFFPIDLRIWRTHEVQEASILLTDAIAGNFQKKPNDLEANRHFDQTFTPNTLVTMNGNPGTGWTANGASLTGSEQNYISKMSNWKPDGGLVSSTSDGILMKNLNHESVGWCSSSDIQLGQSENNGWAMPAVPQSSGHTLATVETPISAKEGLNCELTDPMTVQSHKSLSAGWNASSGEAWGASKSSEGMLSGSLTIENQKSLGGWGGDSNEGNGVLKSSTNLRSSLSTIEASSSGRSSWVGTSPSMLKSGNDGMHPNRALGGSHISEVSMLRNAGWDGGPTKGWVVNQCSDSSWKTPSAVSIEIPENLNEGWCDPKSSENMLASSSPTEPPKTLMDGWGAHQSSESLSRTVSVVETSKSTNEGWGAPPSSESLWPKASEVDASKFTNEGWGAPQSSEKIWTASTAIEASEPITEVGSCGPNENWVGSTPGEGWNASGRTENMDKFTRSDSRNFQRSYHDPDSVGKFSSRQPHEGIRPSRNSKKDIPCKFHVRGFCKRGGNCEFHHG